MQTEQNTAETMKLSSLKQQIEELDAIKANRTQVIAARIERDGLFAHNGPELLRRLLVAEEAASAAAKALNLDDDNSWAADDREGAIDFAHSKLTAALATIRGEEE